jgi:hypothetical protein
MKRSALAFAFALAPIVAHAHDTTPGVLGVEEQPDGRYLVAWRVPVDTRLPSADRVTPRFPAHCTRDGHVLDCGARGLDGAITIDGLEGDRMRVAIVVTRLDAPPVEALVDASEPSVAIDAGASSFPRWIGLGMEHVLLGLDHLAFLLGLLFVSTADLRKLIVTITAFTVAHSLTLGLAVLDLVRPSSALVEALIALSVLLVAREGLREGASSVRRAPWAIAAFFGLVHGLGLAGALRDMALPRSALVPALFGFNVGVELGQLAFVGVAILVASWARRFTWAPRARTALVYAVGIAAAYWLIVRAAAIVA